MKELLCSDLADDELLVVVGPTASGKSDLAMQIAQECGGEIVNADSVQIYRGFDLGSGKPSRTDQSVVPHHLIDIRDPDDPLDAATFAELAERAIADIRTRGRLPVVCGGTFLWVKALLYGLAPSAPKDLQLRERHRQEAELYGRATLHERLQKIDPDSAARLAPNDLLRVSRALEIFELSGRTQTEVFRDHGFREVKQRARLVGVRREGTELDQRIRARVVGWIEQGFIEEVRRLIAQGYGQSRAMGSVGYNEVRAMLAGELPEPELVDAIVRKTRVLVRRQKTWLREQPVRWVEGAALPGSPTLAS